MTVLAGTEPPTAPMRQVARVGVGSVLAGRDALTILAVLLIGTPVIATLLIGVFAGGGATWTHITQTFFWTYLLNTVLVLAGTATLILATAVPTAWLVTMHEFPGRALFSWLLILPLAAPGYVLAFSYADLLGVAGPVQTGLRDITGLSARDYWFPDIRSPGGCAFVLSAALYPYVYLTARAAFTTQSICILDAARSLGAAAPRRFLTVALPGARPAIAAGLALALMEAAADYGAADFLGVQTLTVGVFRAWSSFGDAAAGARLALVLVALTLALRWFERLQRGGAGYQASSARWRNLHRSKLPGWRGALATVACALVFCWGFAFPVARLIWLSIAEADQTPPVWDATWNSVILALSGAGAAFLVGLIIAIGARRGRLIGKVGQWVAASGYAMPGAVLALGGLYALSTLPIRMTASAAILILVAVYVSRFAAAGTASIEAGLERAPASLGQAARSLGASGFQTAIRIDLPLVVPGTAAAMLILFVETLKELPATLMLRPFNWDTLAVRAYAYATDDRLSAAALPSLMITLCGLLPVMLLSWRLSASRPGQRP
ncbi:MAG: iron ABC transporter permease [Pseudomonadota bacterium]